MLTASSAFVFLVLVCSALGALQSSGNHGLFVKKNVDNFLPAARDLKTETVDFVYTDENVGAAVEDSTDDVLSSRSEAEEANKDAQELEALLLSEETECDKGHKLVDGKCVVATFFKCPRGYIRKGTKCEALEDCPKHYFRAGKVCKPLPSTAECEAEVTALKARNEKEKPLRDQEVFFLY